MRPGQQRPGNRLIRDAINAYLESFNEAGATTPRKPWRAAASATAPTCFNEAGATTPRKLKRLTLRHWAVANGFNEAGATTPRKPWAPMGRMSVQISWLQ